MNISRIFLKVFNFRLTRQILQSKNRDGEREREREREREGERVGEIDR